ncbi:MAG: FAD-binding protein [Coriobacteriales bacterium]|nr:FAD-binding protein [Coriobacteriales bacterium]
MSMDRRSFVKTAGIAGGAVAAGVVSNTAFADEKPAEGFASQVTETKECDICVVGAGISGLAAAVQAGEGGAKVIVLEVSPSIGGNGAGTEGMFGVNTSLQKEQGIEVSFAKIINNELRAFNYKIDTTFWRDQYDNAGDNLDWLISNGVKFSGVVDNYGIGRVDTFHWYESNALECYVSPMEAKALEYGVEIITEARGRELVQAEDGTVTGIYATTPNGVLQVNAKAVILASGGFASNPDMMEHQGIVVANSILNGSPYNIGDGFNMAYAAGAFDNRHVTCFLTNALIGDLSFFLGIRLGGDGNSLWINQEAVRYTDENCAAVSDGCCSNAVSFQQDSYMICDEDILGIMHDAWAQDTFDNFDVKGEVASCLEAGSECIFKADTLEELAEQVGLNADALVAAVERYNGYCEAGEDEDFGKDPAMLHAIKTAPFYALKQKCCYGTSMGGIMVNRNYQVLKQSREAIPGLYAVGTDSCMLYYGTYTIEVPASIGGCNLNSGRMAARHALSTL